MKRNGAPPGSCNEEGMFTLQNHKDQNLSTEESIEQIAQYFAEISQEYPPLDPQSLPLHVQQKLNESDPPEVPQLSVDDVKERIRKSKKPKSGYQGTYPKNLLKSFTQN